MSCASASDGRPPTVIKKPSFIIRFVICQFLAVFQRCCSALVTPVLAARLRTPAAVAAAATYTATPIIPAKRTHAWSRDS